jgi:hypothetical protein
LKNNLHQCAVPLNSFTDGANARSNFATGNDLSPPFHQTASCVPPRLHPEFDVLLLRAHALQRLCVRQIARAKLHAGISLPGRF